MEWISVKDRLPKPHTMVLGTYGFQSYHVSEVFYDGEYFWIPNNRKEPLRHLPFWMPKPPPPIELNQVGMTNAKWVMYDPYSLHFVLQTPAKVVVGFRRKIELLCYKTDKKCPYNCPGLCKESY